MHELYDNIELLNADINYLKQNIFSAPPGRVRAVQVPADKNNIFLRQQILKKAWAIEAQYQDVEKVLMLKRLEQ